MSEQHNDGGPAYPTSFEPLDTKDYENRKGMSLRDYFAGQALAGQVAADNDSTWEECSGKSQAEWVQYMAALNAAYCYHLADAMLAERNRRDAE